MDHACRGSLDVADRPHGNESARLKMGSVAVETSVDCFYSAGRLSSLRLQTSRPPTRLSGGGLAF
jgi:hypothetical protein